MTVSGLALNATTLMNHDRWETLSIAAQAGLRSVELSAGKNGTMLHADDSHQHIADIGHKLESMGLYALALGLHRDLSRAEQLKDYLLLMEHASRLNCQIITTAVPDSCNESAFMDGLFFAANRASELGLTICIENHGYKHGSGTSLLPFLQVHPSLKLCYDTGNVLFYSEETPLTDLPVCISSVRHIHLKDKLGGKGEWNFPALGKGKVPFDSIFSVNNWPKTLSASIEIEFTPEGVGLSDTVCAVNASVNYLRNLPLLCGD